MENWSIIFVAGGWHTDFHIRPIVPPLQELGYRVVPVSLRTSHKSSPLPTVPDNINHIQGVIEREVDAGFQICVIGHSVSGQSCAGALSKFLASATPVQRSNIKHAIYISCFWDPLKACDGLTWYDIDYATMWAKVVSPEVFYNDMSPEAARPFVEALAENRAQLPPEIPDLWKSIPSTYLVCQDDLAMPPERQRVEAEENQLRMVEMASGHCPMTSQPTKLAKIIDHELRPLQVAR